MANRTIQISNTQPYKAITFTPGSNIVIDVNKSYRQGKFGFIAVKGHATSVISNDILLSFSSSDLPLVPAESFVLGLGTEWDITKAGYGYVSNNRIIGRVGNGEYFHINIPMIFK